MKTSPLPIKRNNVLEEFFTKKSVLVVAEIGKNFIQTKEDRPAEEYLTNAKELIDAATLAGVDAVKFQTHHLEDEQLDIPIVSPHFKGADRVQWIRRNMNATPLHFWHEVKEHAKKRGVVFFSTPMSRMAAQKLHTLDVPLWKVGSGDVTDFLLLDYLISTRRPIIISTGMVSFSELDTVVSYLTLHGAEFSILYCVSKYPAPASEFNLSTIEHLMERYPGITIGFSDHSIGTSDIALAAVKIGAKIIEKHFSFSRELWGSDHKASLTPSQMKELVDGIHNERYKNTAHGVYYGRKDKELPGAESQFRAYFRKGLVAGCDITAGTLVSNTMLVALRPLQYVKGASAEKAPEIIGKRLKRSVKKHEGIQVHDVE